MSFNRTIEVLESIENRQVEVLMKEIWDSNSTVISISNSTVGLMLEFLQRLTEKALKRITNFDYIIRLNIPSIIEGINHNPRPEERKVIYKSVLQAVADTLHLMDEDNSKLRKLKTELEEEAYYTYSPVNVEKEFELIEQMKEEIYQTLKGRRYLLVTEQLDVEVTDSRVSWLMEAWLPGSRFGSNREWNGDCWWLITCKRKFTGGLVLDLSDLMDRYDQLFSPVFLLEQELCLAAKSVSSKCCMEQRRSMDILGSCMLYTAVLVPIELIQIELTDKELIRMWIAEGLLSGDIKLRHVGSASVAEELNVLTSLDEEGGDESKKEEDNITDAQQSPLFGLGEIILEALTSSYLVRKDEDGLILTSNKIWTLLNKWKSLYKRYNINLNHWSSDRWGYDETEYIIYDPNKWKINKTWILLKDYNAIWMLHPKPNNTTTLIVSSSFELIKGVLCNMSYLRVLELGWIAIEYLPESLSGLTNLRLLYLHRCKYLRSLGTASCRVSSPIGSLEKLEVLDLQYVPSLTEIPDDLGNKKHQLYFLHILNHKITSLPLNLFNDMPNMRELVLEDSRSLTTLSSIVSLTNLETLSLSNTKLVSLAPDTFQKMQLLRVLKLINNPLLETLPKSLCDVEMLEELELRNCPGLKAIDALPTKNLKVFIFFNKLEYQNHWIEYLPGSLSRSYNLRKVEISGFTSLKGIKMDGNIGIRSFSLLDSSITSLSLRGCRELAIIDLKGLKKLEDLDLSGTAIAEIHDIPYCSKLRQLDLQAVPNLRRFPWCKLYQIPKVLNLDQRDFTDPVIRGLNAHGKINQGKLPSEIVVGVCIFVRDSQLFLSLDPKHCTDLLKRGSLQSFYILVASYEKRKEALDTSPGQTIQSQPFEWSFYKDAKLKALAPKPLQVQQPQCNRYVEITSTECYPRGLEGILEITGSLSVKDNIYISSISDLNPRLPMLLALHIEECHKIRSLFNATSGEMVCPQLLDFSVAHLHNMSHLLIEKGACFSGESFNSLKHLHLSQCQRLESIFPDNVLLPGLEMLVITGCTSLRTVFYKSSYCAFDADTVKKFRENHLRSLHTVQLYLLPQLLHIFEEQRVGAVLMPNWKTLFFRGCWCLCQLPLLTGSRDQNVFVDGESKKCNTIKARMDTEQLSHYKFKPKPPIASVKDGVKNRIFLK